MTTAPVGRLDGEQAPKNSLPDWSECARLIENSEFRARAATGLEGSVLMTIDQSPEPTELHRFIYEYDDADRYRSAWFLHRLELLLEETRRSASRQEGWQLVPAPNEHRNFMTAYYKAAHSSLPQDWFDAALMAKQWENEITGGALDAEFRAPHQSQEAQGDSK